jgi:hypothetical protein
MNHTPLAAVHGIEAVGGIALPDTSGNSKRAKPEFFLAEQPEVVGVKAQERVLVGGHPQHLLRQLLKRKQGLTLVSHQVGDVRALELNDQGRSLEISLYLVAVVKIEVDVEIGCVKDAVEEILDLVPDTGNVVFFSAHELCGARLLLLPGGWGGGNRRDSGLIKEILLEDADHVASEPV